MLTLRLIFALSLAHVKCDPRYDAAFQKFLSVFRRDYIDNPEEMKNRKKIFTSNLKRAQRLDRHDNNWVPYGHLSPFADWSQKEFEYRNRFEQNTIRTTGEKRKKLDKVSTSFVTGSSVVNSTTDTKLLNLRGQTDTLLATKSSNFKQLVQQVPTDFDWRSKGAVNPVKNQGQCGSCWSFATVANVEGVAFNEGVVNSDGGTVWNLAEQQLVDCDKSDNGCDGGLPEQADKWMIAHHEGLEQTRDYPYQGVKGECQEIFSRERVFVGNFIHISQDESEIAAALVQYGPLSIGINANTMQMYMGGIAAPTEEECDPEQLNHGVVLVGFGSESTPANPQHMKQMLKESLGYAYDRNTLKLALNLPGVMLGSAGIMGSPDTDSSDAHMVIDEKISDRVKTETPFWIIRNSWGPDWGENGYYRIIRGKGSCGLNTLVTTATDIKNHKSDTTPPRIEEIEVVTKDISEEAIDE